jgi:hypothetical protein
MFGVSISAHAQMTAPPPPPFVQACFGQMTTAQEMFVYRAAGLTVDDVHNSINLSMRVFRYHAEQGAEVIRDLTELAETYHSMADEIFDMSEEDFNSSTFQRAWGKKTMEACLKKLAPENPTVPDRQDLRMIPGKSA